MVTNKKWRKNLKSAIKKNQSGIVQLIKFERIAVFYEQSWFYIYIYIVGLYELDLILDWCFWKKLVDV